MTQEEKAKAYDEVINKLRYLMEQGIYPLIARANVQDYSPELKEYEQNILFEELKALHLKMEYQTVCNDAGGNRMWRRAWRHVNEAINIIKEDKETFKW